MKQLWIDNGFGFEEAIWNPEFGGNEELYGSSHRYFERYGIPIAGHAFLIDLSYFYEA